MEPMVDINVTASDWSNNTVENKTATEDIMPDDQIYLNIYFIDVVLLIANLLAIIANTIVLYVIYKSRSWKTPTHVFIFNWALLDIVHLLTSPGVFKWYRRYFELFEDFEMRSVHMCMTMASEFGIIVLLFFMMYIGSVKLFKTHYLKIICFVWTIVTVLYILSIVGGVHYYLHVNIIFSMIMYVLFLIATLITCIILCIKKQYVSDNDCKLRLTLVSTYLCCWLGFIFAVIVALVFLYPKLILPKEIILLVFALAEMDALANVYILTLLDRSFNIHIYRIFDCRKNISDDKINIVYENHLDEVEVA